MTAFGRTVPGLPWHEGELAIQRRCGVADKMASIGRRHVRDYLIDQHRVFYPLLPFVVVGAVDPSKDAWATILCGEPGFLQAPTTKALHVHASASHADPAARGMGDADAVGLLGIQLETRRRNRLNGLIRRTREDEFYVEVEQSFGNCDRYITIRQSRFERDPGAGFTGEVEERTDLDARARAMVASADTLFVASYLDRQDGRRQVDVSHRGGKPGFVQVHDDGVLTIPDFNGNGFFNTLGNILENPRCGLLFANFETGDVLQLSGAGEVIFDAPEIAAFQGAEHLWRFKTRRAIFRRAALPLRFASDTNGASRNSLLTGSWPEANARVSAEKLRSVWRPFRITRIVEESSTVRSLHLQPADGIGIIPHVAGQHIPVRLMLPGSASPILRTYSLSSAPADDEYRISVKRRGAASAFLHDLIVGDVIEARPPVGAFTLDRQSQRPVVLLAAGVGITPLLSMLHSIVFEGARTRACRPTWLFYAASSKEQRAFGAEIADLQAQKPAAVHVIRTLSDPSGAAASDYEAEGHVSIDLLRTKLPFDDYDFYLCGPGGFMQSLYDGLRALNVADNRIRFEGFGPATVKRRPDVRCDSRIRARPAEGLVQVEFTRSATTIEWDARRGSLLELAEAEGLNPPFSCRAGSCGTCKTHIAFGAVAYEGEPTADHGTDEALICCAVPAAGNERLKLDL
jgi:uncharacterized protein